MRRCRYLLTPLFALLLSACGDSRPEAPPARETAEAVGAPKKPRTSAGDARRCHREKRESHTLIAGKHRASAGFPAKPAKGEGYRDPDYGSCIVRLTDHEHEPPDGFAKNYYSRRQAFNADDSRLLVFDQRGEWHLYDAITLEYLKRLELGGGSVEPHWHPRDPHLLYFLPNRGGLAMYVYDVRSDERREIVDFTQLQSIAGFRKLNDIRDVWPDAARIWTRWEGSPSMDARYWAFQVETDSEEPLGLITLDLKEQRVLGMYDIRKVGRPDHISMSPKGNYAVASWPADNADCPLLRSRGTLEQPCGVMAFSRDFRKATGLAANSPHSDLAVAANGREVIVLSNYKSGDVEMIDLETGETTPLWRIYQNGASTALHVSAKAYRKPGWVLISTYWTKDPKQARPWYRNKLMAVELKDDPRILNIATVPSKVRTYFSEPHASVNRDFTRVIFNANWGTGKDTDVDAYIAYLPPDAIPAASRD